MKLRFTIHDPRLTIEKKSSASSIAHSRADAVVENRQSPIANRKSENGIALVITLIMLSVTLVMAVAFLALSQRERRSVSTIADTSNAKLAADSALAAAQAQIIANLYANNNGIYNFGLFVSTNYINDYGFVPNIANPTNVNFDYYANGSGPLSGPNFIQNVANLQILPRVPVFVDTNAQGAAAKRTPGPLDFRYYLDLNRNAFFDNDEGNQVGDPQWIGVLARPDAVHSANNQFISRYTFFAQPIGNSLDINYIHNDVLDHSLSAANDGFFRNQGVGSWEINLAAFLTDLNTNEWDNLANPYEYNQANIPSQRNQGAGFEDALSILSYRYNYDYNTLASLDQTLANSVGLVDLPVDILTLGSLMTNTYSFPFANNTGALWAGSDSTNKYFDLTSELYDSTKSGGLANHMLAANNDNNTNDFASTYNRHTLYRMLSQLGTDSDPDAGKLNLNYSNAVVNYTNVLATSGSEVSVPTSITIIPGAETNLVSWRPLDFFTAAADRLLRYYTTNWFISNPSNYLITYYGINPDNAAYYHYDLHGDRVTNDVTGLGLTNFNLNISPAVGTILQQTNGIPAFGITNIPVYVNGKYVYTPAVQRLLQLAANMYDATTNQMDGGLAHDYPSVFKPILEHDDLGNIFIVGFQQVTNIVGVDDGQLAIPYYLSELTNYYGLTAGAYRPMTDLNGFYLNVFNVPWIIGAKKGFPTFNQYFAEDILGVTRRIRLVRDTNSASSTFFGNTKTFLQTNQMYSFADYSTYGVGFWNPYASNYNGNIVVHIWLNSQKAITNGQNNSQVSLPPFGVATNYVVQNWPGAWLSSGALNSSSLQTNGWFMMTNLPDSAYRSPTSLPDTYGIVLTNAPGFVPVADFSASGSPGVPQPPYYITQNFETNVVGLPIPQFGEFVTNQLQTCLLDFDGVNYHVIDYVNLEKTESRNLNAEIFNIQNDSVWNTNVLAGIIRQIYISEGVPEAGVDTAYDQPWTGTLQEKESFQAFVRGTLGGSYSARVLVPGVTANTNNFEPYMQTPYTPTKYLLHYTALEANDPLVHDLVSQLAYPVGVTTTNISPSLGLLLLPSINSHKYSGLDFGRLNSAYRPWNRQVTGDITTTASYLKDPLATDSDAWDFPHYKLPNVGWLGRVHRGTPWQTVYLKSTNVLSLIIGSTTGENYWATNWTGDSNYIVAETNNTLYPVYYDAANLAPVKDDWLFDLFTARLNDNAARGTLSVNVGAGSADNLSGLAAWSAVLSGVVVVTNQTGSNNWTVISPAGPEGANSPLGRIVANINNTRANFVNVDGKKGVFEHVGDVLRAPWLTEQSPFISTNQPINDEVYEWIPQQIMGLLRMPGEPRYVIYGYGQALRPAPNGLVTTADDHFGLVTNYQVTAESAVRAVVSVQPQMVLVTNSFGKSYQTNYTTKVESYNVLPPQ